MAAGLVYVAVTRYGNLTHSSDSTDTNDRNQSV